MLIRALVNACLIACPLFALIAAMLAALDIPGSEVATGLSLYALALCLLFVFLATPARKEANHE